MTDTPTLPEYPQGFLSLAKNLGIKDDTLDFTVIQSTVRAAAAGMFTQSLFCGAPITVGREHIADGHLQALVVNSKNANVATGLKGLENAREITRLVGQALNILPEDILPSSTGVIGQQLPIDTFRRELGGLQEDLLPENLGMSARAIMTTDTYPKLTSRRVGNAVIAGMAKGSGMIEPNMATMLSFILTDAAIPPDTLKSMLHEAVEQSFNMVSVDTDTSTSDTTVIMANGLAGDVDLGDFQTALNDMCIELAKEIARDGEGATKLIEVAVSSARDDGQAKRVAKAIVNSPLMKTAVHGADPNWGRVAMAIGKCHEERDIRPETVTISFGDTCIYAKGEPTNVSLQQLETYLEGTNIRVAVDLGIQSGQATVWGCDLTEEYVRINALYTT